MVQELELLANEVLDYKNAGGLAQVKHYWVQEAVVGLFGLSENSRNLNFNGWQVEVQHQEVILLLRLDAGDALGGIRDAGLVQHVVDLVHLGLSPFEGVRILLQDVVGGNRVIISQPEVVLLGLLKRNLSELIGRRLLDGLPIDESVLLKKEVLLDGLEDDILAVAFAEDFLLVNQDEVLVFDSIPLQLLNSRFNVNQFRIMSDISQSEVSQRCLLCAFLLRGLAVQNLSL